MNTMVLTRPAERHACLRRLPATPAAAAAARHRVRSALAAWRPPADPDIAVLVATLADDWGRYRTPIGEAAYFTVAFGGARP